MLYESMSLKKKNQMGMDPIKSPPPDPFNTGRRKTPESLIGFHACELGTELELLPYNSFHHHVSYILTCVDLLQLKSFHFCSIMNSMIFDFNLICLRVIGGIFAQVYCTLVVAIYHILILFQTQFFEKSLYPYHIFSSFDGSYILSLRCR